jgi:hypothetical protein
MNTPAVITTVLTAAAIGAAPAAAATPPSASQRSTHVLVTTVGDGHPALTCERLTANHNEVIVSSTGADE